jgi:LCP family protein required for cell wall assembly
MEPKHQPVKNKKNPAPAIAKEKAQYITIGIGVAVICILVFGIFMLIKNLDFSGIIFSFGKSLRTDGNGRTNILLTGVGGAGHDGPDLTDTVMVASIDDTSKIVTMLSIPRDLYIKDKTIDGQKLNVVYTYGKNAVNSAAGMQDLVEVASGITGLQIDYYAKVDFDGFTKIVDSLGGVDLVVPKDIYDPFYPLGETTKYQTFSIKAGPQHLDGDTALKYARSRETTSDFDRARRQQQLMTAIKDKALTLNILTDPSKIEAIYNSVQSSIETNLSVEEIIELAKMSKDFNSQNIVSHVLSDDPASCGGFLYSPARDFFGGAFVLLPAGKNYDSIHEMADLIFNHDDVLKDEPAIQVLNGTKTGLIAGDVYDYLSRDCFNVVYYGNAAQKNIPATTIYYAPDAKGGKPPVLDLIEKFLPYPEVAGIPPNYLNSDDKIGTQVAIVLGSDYLYNKLPDPFNVLPYYVAPSAAGSEQSTQQKPVTK